MCYIKEMKASVWLVVAALILAPVGFVAAMFLMKLGIESSYHQYGGVFTLSLVGLIFPTLVVLGFLFDKRQERRQDNPTDFQ